MNARGFTIVEALVAFAILALSLVALYGALGTSLGGLARATRHDEAVMALTAKLTEITAMRALPPALEGTIEGTPFRWRIERLAEAETLAPAPGVPLRLQRITLSVTWKESGAARSIAVERRLLLWRGTNE